MKLPCKIELGDRILKNNQEDEFMLVEALVNLDAHILVRINEKFGACPYSDSIRHFKSMKGEVGLTIAPTNIREDAWVVTRGSTGKLLIKEI